MGNCCYVPAKADNVLSSDGPSDSRKCPKRSIHASTHPVLTVQRSRGKGRVGNLLGPRSESDILSSPHLKAFSFGDLRNATRNFRRDGLLGEGGFGFVFKGWVYEQNLVAARPRTGTVMAVKILKAYGSQGHKEWLSELTYLGQLHHPNLVKLIGYCLDEDNRLLVYEFMARGSLENHLFKKIGHPLSWAIRIKVAIGAARGLAFLHDSESQVIYRDFKASNILLDPEFNAKLSDFGLAKAGPTGDQTHVTTRVMGTFGYVAPEYVATGRLTAKCDVYSFGVVLLEMLTGRRAIDRTKVDVEQRLVDWVTPHLGNPDKLFRVMDSRLAGCYPRKAAYMATNLALQCIDSDPKSRPSMAEVLASLEKLQAPRFMTTNSSTKILSMPSPLPGPPLSRDQPSPVNLNPRRPPLPANI